MERRNKGLEEEKETGGGEVRGGRERGAEGGAEVIR